MKATYQPLIVASWVTVAIGAIVQIGEGPLACAGCVMARSNRSAYLAQPCPSGMRRTGGRFYYEVSVD